MMSARITYLIAATAMLTLGGCAGEDARGSLGGATVDTLANGTVVVRNTSAGVWDSEPASRWRLEEVTRIGRLDGDGPDVFGYVGSVIQGPMGRVWVADGQAHEVRVFDTDGGWVRTIGRQGDGPGEFGRLTSLHLGPDGHVWADDAGNARWEVFDSVGERVAGYPVNSNLGGGVRRWTTDGRLAEVNMLLEPGADLLESRAFFSVRRFENGEFSAPDTVQAPAVAPREVVRFKVAPDRYAITRNLPLYLNSTWALGHRGDFWATDGGDAYSIRRLDFEGDTLLIIERDYEPIPVPGAVRDEALEQMQPPEGMTSDDNDPARVPSVYPAFDTLYPATDGSLWVKRSLGEGRTGLDVFNADGIYLGEFELPVESSKFRITLITTDRIYAVATDELDVASVVVMRIER